MEELTLAVLRLGLNHQEEVVARRQQGEVVVREAALEATTLADTRGRLQEQILGTRGQVDASEANLQELRRKVQVYQAAAKEQGENEAAIKKEEETVQIDQERVKDMTEKIKKESLRVEKERVSVMETRVNIGKEEKDFALAIEKLEKVNKVEQKLERDKEVREVEMAALATTTEAEERLVAQAARRVERTLQELVALRQAVVVADLEQARQRLERSEREKRVAESETAAMEGVRELRQQLAEENEAHGREIKVCEERLQLLDAEKQSMKEEVGRLQSKAREVREERRSSEERTNLQEEELGHLAKAVKEMKEVIEEKEAEVSATCKELATQGKKKDQMKHWLEQSTKKKGETLSKVETVEEECKVSSEKLESMKVTKGDHEKEVKVSSKNESKAEVSVVELRKKEAEINRRVSDEDGKVKEIRIKEDELVTEVQRLVETKEGIAEELAKIEVKKASQVNANRALEEEIEVNKVELAGEMSELKTLRRQVEAVTTVGQTEEMEAAIAEMAEELERTKTDLAKKAKEEEEIVNFAEELRVSTKASKEKQAEASKDLKAIKDRFKSAINMETESTAAQQFKAKEVEKMEAKLATVTAEAAELVTREKLAMDTLAKWRKRTEAAREEQQVAAKRFTDELHRMAEEVEHEMKQTEQLKKEVEEKKRQLRATDGSKMEQSNTSRAASTVINSTPSSRASFRRGPSVPTIHGNSSRLGSAISANSSRLGAASTKPYTSTPCSSKPPPLIKPSSIKSGRKMFPGRFAPARRPADQVEKRKSDLAIFDVSSSDDESKLVARSPSRPGKRSRLWLGRGQAGTPPTPVIGVSDSCFDSSY